MLAILQRVKKIKLLVEGEKFSEINQGIFILLSFRKGDLEEEFPSFIQKIINLKMFLNQEGKLGKSIQEVKGEILLVSQFTLYGEIKKGKKPSFTKVAPAEEANKLFEKFHQKLRENFTGKIALGKFGAEMEIIPELLGPVSFIISNDKN